MPGPQKENGYTPIANEIMEALCKYKMPGECRRVLDCVFRMTYGFNRKRVEISNNQIAEMTGLMRVNVVRSVRWLVSMAILSSIKPDTTKGNKSNVLEFNKNYTEWSKVVSDTILSQGSIKNCIKVVSKTSEKQNPTIIVKTNKESKQPFRYKIKKTIPSDFHLTNEMKTYADKKGICLDLEKFTEKFILKCEAKGYTYKNWYSAWQDWLLREWEDACKKNSICSDVPHQKYLKAPADGTY